MASSNGFLGWFRRLFRRKKPLSGLQLTYYTRDRCTICKEVLPIVRKAQNRYGFDLQLVDIDRDSNWTECYGDKVPVLADGERAILWGAINPTLLKRFLDGAVRSRS